MFRAAAKTVLFGVLVKMKTAEASHKTSMTVNLPAGTGLTKAVEDYLTAFVKDKLVDALWAREASVWTNADESKWLDWLTLPERELKNIAEYKKFASEIKDAGFKKVLLLGMGGSSLAPEVFSVTYGNAPGYPALSILDSTDPAQIRAVDASLDYATTLFVVSSKSGSTLEPNIFMRHFVHQAKEKLGEKFGEHFIAITDPGSKLEGEAKAMNFRRIFHGLPGIGGRYSALSPFGVVPMCLIGMDAEAFLSTALQMANSCRQNIKENPGLVLGAIMGQAQVAGIDKLTIFTSPSLYDFGAWLEQLVAESTGKVGKAIIPVDQEVPGESSVYGTDRLFVFVKLAGDRTAHGVQNEAIEAFLDKMQEKSPVVEIVLSDKIDLAGEFFRFEFATAVAGAAMQINPFDQPDVEFSKVETRELTTAYEQTGHLPSETPFFSEGDIELYSDEKNAAAIKENAQAKTLVGMLKAHLDRLSAGDYFALLAYLHMDHSDIESSLFKMRMQVRDKKHVATCLGFGPRFLHSTGQAYKGGAASGVFLQVTADDSQDLPVPDAKYTFSVVKAAQARGDFQVLTKRDRRALRVHIKGDLKAGLAKLKESLFAALT